jgi:hypothetical protein
MMIWRNFDTAHIRTWGKVPSGFSAVRMLFFQIGRIVGASAADGSQQTTIIVIPTRPHISALQRAPDLILANAVCCPEIAGWGSRCNSIE